MANAYRQAVPVDGSVLANVFDWSGWSAFVAIGTLALAFVTYRLVRTTKVVAEGAQAEIAAQWRPVLFVRDRVPGVPAPIIYENGTLTVWIENVGRGPAFAIRPWLDGFPAPGPAYGVPTGTTPMSGGMSTRLYQAMAAGDLVSYQWTSLGEPLPHIGGRLTYWDMSGAGYETRFIISDHGLGGPPVITLQQIEVLPGWVEPRWRAKLPGRAVVAIDRVTRNRFVPKP
jgi:hypothetical protein